MEGPEQLLLHPPHHQEQTLCGEALIQQHHGMLGVPQGGGVGGGDDHHTVGAAGGQPEALSQPRRGVDQAIVILLAHLVQQLPHLVIGHVQLSLRGQGSGQQVQLGILGVIGRGVGQGAAAGDDVGKIHQGLVRQPQGQVQVPQGDVAVQAQGIFPKGGQRQTHVGGEGGLSGAALAGDHCNDFSHIQVPRIQLGTQPNGAFLMRAKGRG